jgi:hypothetical protein
MLDTLSTYRTAFNDAVNDKLINGLFDIPLEEHVKEIISSLETCNLSCSLKAEQKYINFKINKY